MKTWEKLDLLDKQYQEARKAIQNDRDAVVEVRIVKGTTVKAAILKKKVSNESA